MTTTGRGEHPCDIDARLAAGVLPGKIRISPAHPLHNMPRVRTHVCVAGGVHHESTYFVTLGARNDWCSVWAHRHNGLYTLTAGIRDGCLDRWTIEHEATQAPERLYCHRLHYLFHRGLGDIWPPAMITMSPEHRGQVLMGFPHGVDSPDAHRYKHL